MITAFLAQSGGRVLFPEATSVVLVDPGNEARFLDSNGRILAVFSCPDLTAYQVADGDGTVKLDLSSKPAADGRGGAGIANLDRTRQL